MRLVLVLCCAARVLAAAHAHDAIRRCAIRGVASAYLSALLPLRCSQPAAAYTLRTQAVGAEELDALDLASRADPGTLLPSGVRVIDVVKGDGRLPEAGERVYCNFKVWTEGFRSGAAADLTFLDGRPYGWVLGSPTARLPPGADEGVRALGGMREGGWRRLVIPSELAYGERGLRKSGRAPGGFKVEANEKAGFAVKPNTDIYFDLRMVDGGSGCCDAIFRPNGREVQGRLTSLDCVKVTGRASRAN